MANYIVMMSRSAGNGGPPVLDGRTPDELKSEIETGLAKAGGQLVKLSWTLGRYDLVAEVAVDRSLLDANDDIAHATDADIANGFAYWLGRAANVHTETLTALDPASALNALVVAARCGGSGPGTTPAIIPPN
jgi:uncharacterized protein with GYD domain